MSEVHPYNPIRQAPRTDTERLDALEHSRMNVIFWDEVGRECCLMKSLVDAVKASSREPVAGVSTLYPTLRAAIDAYLDAEKGK